MKTNEDTLTTLKSRFDDLDVSEFRGQTRVVMPASAAFSVLQFLKDELGFDFLSDITCVDYLNYRDATDRFGLVYIMANTLTNERITIRVMLNDPDPTIESVTSLWEGANWLEREVYDMFGIHFEGHPDLRRILMPEEFAAYPLRKDYPLQGRGERHNFPVLRRDQA